MQRLSGTARDFFVVAAVSTINVEVVLGEFVRCFHRPPGNSSPTRRSTVGGGGTRKPARDPIGYGREAMRWRMWSNWRQVSARSGGQSLKKYNRFDITDHHRSDMGPSKPRVAGSSPCRARQLTPGKTLSGGDTNLRRNGGVSPFCRQENCLTPRSLGRWPTRWQRIQELGTFLSPRKLRPVGVIRNAKRIVGGCEPSPTGTSRWSDRTTGRIGARRPPEARRGDRVCRPLPLPHPVTDHRLSGFLVEDRS